jgi:hypothetical protein
MPSAGTVSPTTPVTIPVSSLPLALRTGSGYPEPRVPVVIVVILPLPQLVVKEVNVVVMACVFVRVSKQYERIEP